MRIEDEIQQTRSISGKGKAILNVLVTADRISSRTNGALKPLGISKEQYNVLRILKGAGAEGCSCQQIADRMISHDPDITRLLDKLIARELVTRERSLEDRRVIITRITKKGQSLLKRLEKPSRESLDGLLGHLNRKQATQLIDLLELAREQAG